MSRDLDDIYASDDNEDCWDDDYCTHDDYEIDTISGHCRCYSCGRSWWASDDQIQAEIDHQNAYVEWTERENRREWWRNLRDKMFGWIHRPLARRAPVLDDDEIPF